MNLAKFCQRVNLFFIVGVVGLNIQVIFSPITPLPSEAQNPASLTQRNRSQQRVVYRSRNPPPGKGKPPSSRPLGPRPGGKCSNPLPLIALAPTANATTNSKASLSWGITAQKSPTLWFYVPYESRLIDSIEIRLRHEGNNTVHRQTVTIPEKPGIIGIPITKYTLETDVWYEANLIVTASCSSTIPKEPQLAATWVIKQDLDATLKRQLDQATPPLSRATFYAQNSFWYDALTATTEMKCSNPENEDWESLLQSVDLEKFVAQPIVSGCAAGRNDRR